MNEPVELPEFAEEIGAVAWVAAEICRRRRIPLESPIAGRVFDLVWAADREPWDEADLEEGGP